MSSLVPRFTGRRARRELEEQLRSISDRLDTLETAPAPEYDLDRLRGIMAGVSGQTNARLNQMDDERLALEKGLQALDERVKKLVFAVAEGIERVNRYEGRIHATIKRARKELADSGFQSPGLETEAAQLQLIDGGGGPDSGVPDVPTEVVDDPDAPSSIRGVPAAVLRRVRGF